DRRGSLGGWSGGRRRSRACRRDVDHDGRLHRRRGRRGEGGGLGAPRDAEGREDEAQREREAELRGDELGATTHGDPGWYGPKTVTAPGSCSPPPAAAATASPCPARGRGRRHRRGRRRG